MDARRLDIRRRFGRLWGSESEFARPPLEILSVGAAAAIGVALFAAIFAVRMLSSTEDAGYVLLFSIPIALIALRFGVKGGVTAAVAAELLFVIAAQTVADYEGVLPYVTRAVAFLTLGLVVGYLSQRLAASEHRFRLALNNAPVVVYMLDRDLRYTWVHRSYAGRAEVSMLGKTDLELLPPEEAEEVFALKQRVLRTGVADSQEVVLHDPAGRPRWFRTGVEPVRDGGGQVIGLTGASFDVTELKEANRLLEESEQRFRTAVENLLEPFALYSSVRDEDGAIIDFRCDYINLPGAESVGMRREDMLGKRLSELYPGRLEYGLLDRYRAVAETGEPLMREEVDYINVFGEQEMVRAFDIRVAKLGDGVEVTWRDITARKRAERERDWTAAIVDQSIDAIMSAELDGTLISWSRGAEQLYGWKAEEIIGKQFMPLLLPESVREARRSLFARVIDGESIGPVRATERHKDGRLLDLTFTATPIFEDGEIVGVARIVRPTEARIVEIAPGTDEQITSSEARS